MKVSEIVKELNLEVITSSDNLEREVTSCYVSDMLSDVIAHAKRGSVWVTMQKHLNIVPVAMVNDLSAVIIVHGRIPDQETILKADAENLPLLVAQTDAFQVTGKLYPHFRE
jgi:predicted transcriptional regulator